MLSELRATPRPQPPAKARKPSLLSNCYPPPPPPYSSAMDSVLGSPIPVTAQLLGSSPDINPGSPGPEDWIREKSREELSDLLLKADEIIKFRESELGFTSAICKSLYQDNVILKSKHDALVSRLPSSYLTPVVSPLGSPQFRGISSGLPVDDAEIIDSPTYEKARRKRTTRISVTQEEIGELADQNSELLDQIEKLESEASQADQAGKRKLRKLEQEIQGLREDLYKTQAELEEAEKVALDAGNDDIRKQRQEREERLYALRNKRGGNDPEVLDFAPPSSHVASPSLPLITASPRAARAHRPKSLLSVLDEHDDPNPMSYFTFPSRKKELHLSEHAIISQLLLKVRELEETNEEISQEHRVAVAKLRSAQRGAETMRRVYDCLSDEEDVEVEFVPESAQEGAPSESQGDTTIRFSSLRRTINEDMFKLLLEEPIGFGTDIEEEMHSTVRSSSPTRYHKARKSVVGLFDDPSSPASSMSRMASSTNDRPSRPLPSNGTDAGRALPPHIFSRGGSPTRTGSPLLSSGDTGVKLGHTLGSELGSEFDEDWNANAGNYHLRTTSLYSLTQFVGDLSGLPSSAPPEQIKLFDVEGGDSDSCSQMKPKIQSREVEQEECVSDSFYNEKSHSRFQRLSQTAQSRTHKWIDGRFDKSALLKAPEKIAPQPVKSTPALLTEVFEAAMEEIVGTSSSQSDSPHTPEESFTVQDLSVTETKSSDRQVQRQGVVGFALEVWLWLQFIIVIMVFLWAMAKRGPKSVLQDAERKAKSRA